jgi:formamidopyrimidine-DNA glycosylase
LDFILEFLAYLGIRVLKKKKKGDTELTNTKTIDQNQEKDRSGRISPEDVPVCAGCNRIIERDAVHESGQVWCMECYKSRVLKVQE